MVVAVVVVIVEGKLEVVEGSASSRACGFLVSVECPGYDFGPWDMAEPWVAVIKGGVPSGGGPSWGILYVSFSSPPSELSLSRVQLPNHGFRGIFLLLAESDRST